jgi:copper homeostasis protein
MVRLLKVQQIPHMKPSKRPSSPLIELCAGSIEDVILAAELQVDRIELNSGIAVGGLTPPAGLVAAARRTFSGPIIAMVRPREAGFAYTDAEFTQMLDDCEFLLASGVEGIAIGFLKPSGAVDVDRCAKLRRLFPKATLVFHKAFDATPDLSQASLQLVDTGFDRILTSGGRASAIDGSPTIRQLRNLYGTQIEYIVAGGVRAHNLDVIVRETECDQIHTAARTVVADLSIAANCQLDFGSVVRDGVTGYGTADRGQLSALISIASKISVPRDSAEPAN